MNACHHIPNGACPNCQIGWRFPEYPITTPIDIVKSIKKNTIEDSLQTMYELGKEHGYALGLKDTEIAKLQEEINEALNPKTGER